MSPLLIGVASALAAEVVVVDGGLPEEAIARVRPHTAAELEARHVDELRAAPPAVLGRGSVPPCPGEPVAVASIRDRVYAATGALLYMEYGRAHDELEAALASAPCATGPGLREPLAELYYLRGLVHALEDQQTESIEAFRRARVLGIDRWNADLGATGEAWFEAAATAPAPEVTVSVLAPEPGALPTIDGRPLVDGMALATGPHVIESESRSVLVDVVPLQAGPSEATVVLPDAFPQTSLAWAAEDGTRAPLSTLLAGTLGEGTSVWVLTGEEAWHGTAGRTDWRPLPAPELRRPPSGSPWAAERRGRPVATGTLLAGAVVGVASGVTALALVPVATEADAARVGAVTPAAYADADRRYQQAATGIVVGRTAAAAGGAVAAVGLTLHLVR